MYSYDQPKYKAKETAKRGAYEAGKVAAIISAVVLIANQFGLEIKEEQFYTILAGATAFLSIYRMVRNWLRNSGASIGGNWFPLFLIGGLFVAFSGCATMHHSVLEQQTGPAPGESYHFEYQAKSQAAPFGKVTEPTHNLTYEELQVGQAAGEINNEASAEVLSSVIQSLISGLIQAQASSVDVEPGPDLLDRIRRLEEMIDVVDGILDRLPNPE